MCKGDDEKLYVLTFLAMIALIYWLSFGILYNYTWLVGLVIICLILILILVWHDNFCGTKFKSFFCRISWSMLSKSLTFGQLVCFFTFVFTCIR